MCVLNALLKGTKLEPKLDSNPLLLGWVAKAISVSYDVPQFVQNLCNHLPFNAKCTQYSNILFYFIRFNLKHLYLFIYLFMIYLFTYKSRINILFLMYMLLFFPSMLSSYIFAGINLHVYDFV